MSAVSGFTASLRAGSWGRRAVVQIGQSEGAAVPVYLDFTLCAEESQSVVQHKMR